MIKTKSPIITHVITYGVGSVEEVSKKEGIAHLLEHTMFLGTNAYSKDALAEKIKNIGATYNASTSYDYTSYYYSMPKIYIEDIIKIEADRMQWLVLDEKLVNNEIKVVNEERNMRNNNPYNKFYENFRALAFPSVNYGRSIIGWEKNFNQLTAKDLRKFYKTWYVPNNATVVIIGDIDFESTSGLVKEYYAKIRPKKGIESLRADYMEESYTSNVYVDHKSSRIQQNLFTKSYLVPSIISQPDKKEAYALNILAYHLSSPSSSLYKGLIFDKKLATSFSVYYNPLAKGNTLFTFTVVPNNNVSMELLDEYIGEQLHIIQKKGISRVAIKNAIQGIKDSLEFLKEDSQDFAQTIGVYLSAGADIKDILSPMDSYLSLKIEDVNKVYSDLINKHFIIATAQSQ